jgi:hypothetical protein
MAKTDDTDKTRKTISISDSTSDKDAATDQVNEVPETPDVKEAAVSSSDVSLATDAPDPKTDAAVDEIMKTDGDDALEAQDASADAVVMQLSPWERFKNGWRAWWANPKKRYLTLGAVVLMIGAVFAVPVTRYDTLGLVLKKPVTIRTVDSKTGAPVSGVTVMLAGRSAETDANGLVTLQVSLGSKTLEVSKSYYKGTATKQLVTLSASRNNFKASLTALGRQVRVKVVDKVSGKPVSGATVMVGNSKAKTDTSGGVTVVTPVSNGTQTATVSVKGYNDAKVSIAVGGDLAKNTFAVLPSGKLYFLSNLSGRIDVVKTNLDGTDRQVVLEGTGNEDRYSTSLLASRDWKYLALLAKRDGKSASVYMIDTTNNDKLTTIDQGDASFSFVGWSNDRFIYQVNRNSVQVWQSNRQALKSLDAASGQTLLLDQTQASGTSGSDYMGQNFGNVYLFGNQVVYPKSWAKASYTSSLSSNQGELDAINADGSGHKVLKSFSYSGQNTYYDSISVSTQPYEVGGLYIETDNNGANQTFYKYEGGKVVTDASITADSYYNNPYSTYLLSPSGGSTFWSDQRDGKNMLFTGDQNGEKSKTIASLSDYSAYGWFTDNYLLVSKNSSELYIMGKDGGTPLKITDYYKPSINYQGYGGGYGGL